MPNFSYITDSSFQPFSFQELLTPYMMYKEEYDRQENAFDELVNESDKFKYLSESLPEGSKARQIYEGYANSLSAQAEDLARNGLSVNSRRALTNLKRRYQGEIGRLVTADEAMQQERQLRRQMNAKDSSMLYATDNLNIDDFLDGNNPNLYNISGTELYTRGAAAGKSASARVYNAGDGGKTLGGYYRKWVERNGYSKESMDAFRANAAAIPELQQVADAILVERGVEENLRENPQALRQARQSVLNGIIDGAVYQESVKPVRDEGVMSAAQRASNALGWANHNAKMTISGYTQDKNGNWSYDPKKDLTLKRAESIANARVPEDANGNPISAPKSTNSRSGNSRKPKDSIWFSYDGNMSGAVTPTNSPNRGKIVSYAEAVEKCPSLAQYDPANNDLYDYFDNGNKIFAIKHLANAGSAGIGSYQEENYEDSSDDEY